jgi:hypothetical protein
MGLSVDALFELWAGASSFRSVPALHVVRARCRRCARQLLCVRMAPRILVNVEEVCQRDTDT